MIKRFAVKIEGVSDMRILALSVGIIGTDVHPLTLLPLSYQVRLLVRLQMACLLMLQFHKVSLP